MPPGDTRPPSARRLQPALRPPPEWPGTAGETAHGQRGGPGAMWQVTPLAPAPAGHVRTAPQKGYFLAPATTAVTEAQEAEGDDRTV
ncbi:hypothetical protein ON010_g17270 [Phytophthora cinnamomi]|nr:hypothetical protein ON010_g17270 [Phytophthora cinnamomi]